MLLNAPDNPSLYESMRKRKTPTNKFQRTSLLLINSDPSDDDIAGFHAVFIWVLTGGGFFLEASNIRGKPVYLNGKCLIPYENSIGIVVG
jgi:hypothetical protein